MIRNKTLLFLFLFMLIPFLAAAAETVTSPGLGDTFAEDAVADPDRITLDFKEADINTVLRVLSLKSKVNIVAGPEVQGNVTIRLENVPWEKALQVVLRTYGYVFERDGNIIRVTTRENLAAEPLVTQTFVLNYTKASEVQTAVQDILTERGRIKIAERTNTLIVTDVPTNLYGISEVLKKLDRPTPAAFIDSRVVATTLGITENLGIQWQTGGDGNLGQLGGASRPTTFPFASNTKNNEEIVSEYVRQFFPRQTSNSIALNPTDPRYFPSSIEAVTGDSYAYGTMSFAAFGAVLQALRSRANTKIVSNPRIVVLNNQTANIHVGDNIPLPTFDTNSTTGRLVVSGFDYDKLKTGVTLDVTPHINSNEEILVELKPSVNARGANISFNQDLSAPIINETTATTQVLIHSGQTIAIGGLLTDNTQTNEAKIPYLSEIPLLGKLFRSKRQTAGSSNAKVETLFFVTVTVVDSEGQPVLTERDKKKAAALKAKAAALAPKKVVNANQPATTAQGEEPAAVAESTVTNTEAAPAPAAA